MHSRALCEDTLMVYETEDYGLEIFDWKFDNISDLGKKAKSI